MTRPQKPNRAQRRKSGKAPASQRETANSPRVRELVKSGFLAPLVMPPVGTVTGRFPARNPEMLNLPSGDKQSREVAAAIAASFRQWGKVRINLPEPDATHTPIEPLDAGLRRYLGYDR